MNIAYSCNDYYIPQTGISLISLLENNKEVEELNIFLISKDIAAKNIKEIESICSYYGRDFSNIPFEHLAYDLNLSSTGRHIETIYSKIFFSRIKNLDKCLYIDSDTIIIDSLESLWNVDLTDKYLAAVETISTNFKKSLQVDRDHIFFNDGVTLLNVDYCRKNRLIERSLALIKEYEGNPPVLSEGVLNKICHNKIRIVSMRYNLMSGMYQIGLESPGYLSSITSYSKSEIEEACNTPAIIHYLSGYYNRPWSSECTHPLKNEFEKYKKLSPWQHCQISSSSLPNKINGLKQIGDIIGYSNLLRLSKLKFKIKNLIKLY